MRPTSLSESAFATLTKSYLTINDLYTIFAGKVMRAKLFAGQYSSSSLSVSAPRQTRITAYFQPTSKWTKSEASISVYGSAKQSARTSPQRAPSSRPSPYSASVQPLFSTNPISSPVCWRCQGPFATCLPRNWTGYISARAEIPVRRRGRRLFV